MSLKWCALDSIAIANKKNIFELINHLIKLINAY